jgi:quercetin dioxygenase-like cupin family protein
MKLKKSRWSKVYESSEEELAEFLRAKHIASRIWDIPPFEKSAETFSEATTLYCAEGSLAFRAEGASISLQPGDILQVPAGTAYEIEAGIAGYVCYVANPS